MQTTTVSALPKMTSLARYLAALGLTKNTNAALQYAERAGWKTTPHVAYRLKAPIGAGTTSTDGWASELAPDLISDAYLELERAGSILGALRPVLKVAVFNTTVVKETVAATTSWIAENARKPVSSFCYDTVAIAPYKCGVITVFTSELLRFSKPSAERIVSRSLPLAMAKFLDEQFLDPTVAEVASTNPASITNGAAVQVSSGSTLALIQADLSAMCDALGSWVAPYWLMKPKTLAHLAALNQGFLTFQGANAWLLGIPVIKSTNSPSQIVLADVAAILLADDGGVEFSKSDQANLIMDDGGSPNVSTWHNLFQEDLVGLRAERTISWKRGHSDSVTYMSVTY